MATVSEPPFFARCARGGETFDNGPAAPSASLNDGAAGIGYALLRLGRVADADAWCERLSTLGGRDGAFHGGRLDGSFFHGRAGVPFVDALVGRALGDRARTAASTAAFVDASRTPTTYDDLTLGLAGHLIACAELVEHARGAPDPVVVARGAELDAELAARVDRETIATSTRVPMLGMAHGWAGITFARLRWAAAVGAPSAPHRARLDELATFAEPVGRGVRFAEHNATVAAKAHHPGFCHGVAGHALLWGLAAEIYDEPAFAALAERCAIAAWAWSVALGTLCCGLAGVAYGLAAAHRVTGSAVWLRRAKLSAAWAPDDTSGELSGDGLYFGAGGVTLVAEELASNTARMPLVERRFVKGD